MFFGPEVTEVERRERLEGMRRDTPKLGPVKISWTEHDIERLKAAFAVRFNEPLPRTETLMAVASEGARIYRERTT